MAFARLKYDDRTVEIFELPEGKVCKTLFFDIYTGFLGGRHHVRVEFEPGVVPYEGPISGKIETVLS